MANARHDESSSYSGVPLPPPIPPPLPPSRRMRGSEKSPAAWFAGCAALLLIGGLIGWTARGWSALPPSSSAVAEVKQAARVLEQVKSLEKPKSAPDAPSAVTSTVTAPEPVAVAVAATVLPTPPADAPEAATAPAQPAAPPATPPPSAPPAPEKSAPAPPRKTTRLFQELELQRMPKFGILGEVTVQDLQYKILSELKITEPDDTGVRTVEQGVVDTRLVKSDDLSRAFFEQSLQELNGWQFTFQLNRAGQIVSWHAGPADGKKAPGVEVKGVKGFLVTSVLDEDGWKELTQLSFFVPEEQARPNQVWSRPMAHSFGSLGSWYGQTDFRRKGTQKGVTHYDYAHKMTYQPPEQDRGGLPFTIKAARFQAEIADGGIHYDTALGRVISARDRFLVRGEVTSEILGQAVAVQVEEQQVISLRLTDEKPAWQ